jgi:carboxyl-terminal processing protease
MHRIIFSAFLLIGGEPRPQRFEQLGDQLVELVRAQFYRADAAKTWADKYAGYGAAARDEQDFARLTRSALAELRASHTAYYTKGDVENAQLRSIYAPLLKKAAPEVESIGADIAELSGNFFVRHVHAGGPAAQAGLQRGDRIVTADRTPFHPVASLAGKAGKKLRVEVEREPNGVLLALTIVPRKIAPTEEWLQAQEASSRIVERRGRKIAYHQIYNCAGPKPLAVLDRAVKGRLIEADALVLDLRDGWGGCPPELTNLFNRRLPVLRSVDRSGKEAVWVSAWMKPVVLLINENTRSGKEIVAFVFQKHDLGPVVGRRTAGAFLAGRPFVLADGSVLYLALSDSSIDGVRLEGVGVAPDVEVDAALPHAGGKDPQLERALDVACELVP